jgi:hypothetical protein
VDRWDPGNVNSNLSPPRAGCVHDPLDCDDGNVCTTDSCDPSSGCINQPNNLPCDDESPCTKGDQCFSGLCQGATQPDCNTQGVWTESLLVSPEWPDAQIKHAILLKTGKVLGIAGATDYYLFDPVTETTTVHGDGPTTHNLVGSGHSALPDGRILFAGGNGDPPQLGGTRLTTTYDPISGTWDSSELSDAAVTDSSHCSNATAWLSVSATPEGRVLPNRRDTPPYPLAPNAQIRRPWRRGWRSGSPQRHGGTRSPTAGQPLKSYHHQVSA